PDRLHEEADILEKLRRGDHVSHLETVHLRKDGSPVHIALTISPITDTSGQVVGISKIAHDISRRKATEEALARRNAELHAQAEELTRFNQAAVGRELRMIELKKEINELCERHGEPVRYPLEFEQEGTGHHDTDPT
ncbi:MAG TPA: PAS domain-containing protein, partial [Nitrospira sp.]|nr:PAS domain-containing protein [Nitrospira sp.]